MELVRESEKGGVRYFGINHETFWAGPGQWETINGDLEPTLLGAASVPVTNELSGKREWVRTLVEGGHEALKGQYRRMERAKA